MDDHPDALERWGWHVAARPRRVIAAWLVAAALLAVTGRSLAEGTVSSLSVPGTESQQAVEVLQQSFPQRAGDYLDIVLSAPAGLTDPAVRAPVEDLLTGVAAVPGVGAVVSPYGEGGLVSPDGTVAIMRVQFAQAADDVPAASIAAVEALAAGVRGLDLTVELGGPVALAQEREGPNESTVLGLLFATFVLFVLFRALLPSVLPIVSSLGGLAVGFAAIFLMTAFVDLSKFAPNIAAMLGLGIGIDYALFIVARYRENLLDGHGSTEALGVAMATAGRAVVFAGGVVITSLLGLGLMGIPFVGWLGVAAAAMVVMTMLTALTLLPALLALVGPRVLGGRRASTTGGRARDGHPASRWYRLGLAMMRRPYLFFAASATLLVVLSLPVVDMRLGSADAGTNPSHTTTRRAYDLVAGAFGPGMNGPLQVVVTGTNQASVEAVRTTLSATEGVRSVSPPTVNAAGDTAVLSVIPASSPQATETADLVHALRDEVLPLAVEGSGATTYVGGATARAIDIADRIAARLPAFFGLVIGISFILLVMVFRSLAIPVKAALMNLLSIGAAYGVVVAVFQWGWGMGLVGVSQAGPIESFLPMMLFAVLFGLSMDYEVFLVGRIREEYLHSHDNAEAVARGLAATASVITAAAAIMIMVFLSFVLNEQRVVKEFGLGLAVAVLVDATVVRLLLVPATMELMGDWNWWLPAWLDRLLPRVAIEAHERGAPAPVPVAAAIAEAMPPDHRRLS